ncbi:carcinoembryonic antigen-related cell adhesion molecule 21-like [Phyllostomus discolor]|uniref:Carcinoembryonic antigen-related cell adhesion molecule 21-like n=1 Tax=Phyllostomus discolor TaxID=89673 RepID=A0A7E6CRE9_9CHIR|nr:carcinoembryonic antigen-related cell adhesion molecule 21-like [Phyllostomus discolor]
MPQNKAQCTEQQKIVPRNVMREQDVVLPVHNKTQSSVRITWYRGNTIKNDQIIAFLTVNSFYNIRGPADGPVSINKDGSLVLRKVTMNDTGIYTIVIQHPDTRIQIGLRQLNVYEPVRMPILLASNTTFTENKGAVVLTCYTDELTLQWLFNGLQLQLTERMKLSEDHRNLTIDPVKREDAGNYQCEVFNPISSLASVPIELDVKSE